MHSALLLMATIALLAPAAVSELDLARGEVMAQNFSAALAVLLIVAYGLSLLFSLKTHKELFASEDHGETGRQSGRSTSRSERSSLLPCWWRWSAKSSLSRCNRRRRRWG